MSDRPLLSKEAQGSPNGLGAADPPAGYNSNATMTYTTFGDPASERSPEIHEESEQPYTHYYRIRGWNMPEWEAIWPGLIQDALVIAEASDVPLVGRYDEESGIRQQLATIDKGIFLNGVADDSHEPLEINRLSKRWFVKTVMKPYDIVVACILLRAYLLAPIHVELSSDGYWDEKGWIRARQLYQCLWPGERICCPWEEDYMSTTDIIENEAIKQRLIAQQQNRVLITKTIENGDVNCPRNARMPKIDLLLSAAPLGPLESTVSKVDFTRIDKWLSLCHEGSGHDRCKPWPIQWLDIPGIDFRVIDVRRRCIVKAPANCSYIALSYVWGRVEQLKLTAATMPLLMGDGGINYAWPSIPMTIRDAIITCAKLNVRYLWVDALCIMQDSTRDTQIQTLRMKQIYTAALCTIAAVSAETANFGLLGSAASCNAGTLRAPDSNEDLFALFLESSPWAQRAWCYQEQVLSHRMLLFTDKGIYMQCQNCTYDMEGTPMKQRTRGRSKFSSVGGMLWVEDGQELESYISAVEYYSARKLTKEEDKMNAFQGILKRYGGTMDGKSTSFCYGLPVFAFDQTFCWRTCQHNPKRRNRSFPSWSWLGWNDAVRFDRKLIKLARTNHMIHGCHYLHDDFEGQCQLRKPVAPSCIPGDFGFPVGFGGNWYNSAYRGIWGSITNLCISHKSVESEGSNGLYAVYPTNFILRSIRHERCTLAEEGSSTLPLSVPVGEYDINVPSCPDDWEAPLPLGYIWLDHEWRLNQPGRMIMEFLAIAGKKAVPTQDKWTITMLMCLQFVLSDSEPGNHRVRVQVMDCNIEEEQWFKIGAKAVFFYLM